MASNFLVVRSERARSIAMGGLFSSASARLVWITGTVVVGIREEEYSACLSSTGSATPSYSACAYFARLVLFECKNSFKFVACAGDVDSRMDRIRRAILETLGNFVFDMSLTFSRSAAEASAEGALALS